MSDRRQTIRNFAAAFATCDVAQIVSHVSDDLVWELNGTRAGEGRAAFEDRMTQDLAAGRAEVTIERFVEDGETVVALNRGRFVPNEGGDGMPFVSAEVYTFVGDKIARIQTYQPMG